jgi:hypothetical protein
LQQTAIAVGFPAEEEFRGYNVEIFSPFILEDEFVIAELEKNWAREIAEVGEGKTHPDHVLKATLASFSEVEKAALRRRVRAAFEKWDSKP